MTETGLDLWLVRHGETDWNRERRTQGHSQNPLSEMGVKQARRLAQRLASETFDVVVSFDLKRALQTAEIVFPDSDIVRDERLRELCQGEFEGTTDAERSEERRALLRYVLEDRINRHVPGGECFRDLTERVTAWLEALPTSGKVIAFTHGGVIYAVLHRLVGDSPAFSFASSNTGITRLVIKKGHTTISFVNDHAHVLGRENPWSY